MLHYINIIYTWPCAFHLTKVASSKTLNNSKLKIDHILDFDIKIADFQEVINANYFLLMSVFTNTAKIMLCLIFSFFLERKGNMKELNNICCVALRKKTKKFLYLMNFNRGFSKSC